jgi:hypothetical protein
MKKLSSIRRACMVKILKTAKSNVAAGREYFICCAIGRAKFDFDRLNNDAEYLCEWIHKMLGEYMTLNSWLAYKKNIKPNSKYLNIYNAKLRQARVNWIDWMINELEQGR